MRRAALSALALLVLAAPTPVWALTQRTSLAAIEAQVMCVTCGIPLAEADSPAAAQEKQFIQSLVAQGRTAAYIKRQLVAQYTAAVLDLPPDRGFNVAFYILPIAVVAAALGVVALLAPRWRRNRVARSADAAAKELSPAENARIDADMAGFDG